MDRGISRVDVAVGKAWGALGLGISSRTIRDRMRERPALAQHREGKVRILALASRTRSPLAPEIPTVSEALGIENFEAALWNVVAVPVGTPAQIVDTLHAATMKVMAEPALQERLRALGIEPTTDSTPAAAREFIVKERERKFKPVVQATGASID